jgi:hypothetical protein
LAREVFSLLHRAASPGCFLFCKFQLSAFPISAFRSLEVMAKLDRGSPF